MLSSQSLARSAVITFVTCMNAKCYAFSFAYNFAIVLK